MSAASAGPRVFLDSETEETHNPDDEVRLSGSNPWKRKVQNFIAFFSNLHFFYYLLIFVLQYLLSEYLEQKKLQSVFLEHYINDSII